MEYLYDFGLDNTDIEIMLENADENTFSEMTLVKNLIKENIHYLTEFGIKNCNKIIIKYPEIFLRDTNSLANVLSKFDKEDLIAKVENNPAVLKKMVDFVDNNWDV